MTTFTLTNISSRPVAPVSKDIPVRVPKYVFPDHLTWYSQQEIVKTITLTIN